MKTSCLIAFAFIFLWTLWAFFTTTFSTLFWDLAVYARAVQDYLAGVNPYRFDAGLTFVYHPYVLRALAWLATFAPLGVLFALIYVCATVLFVHSVVAFASDNKYGAHPEGRLLPLVLIIWAGLSLGSAGFTAIKTGNLTVFLHFLVLGIFLKSVRSRGAFDTTAFVLALVVSAIIKPYFLAYVILLPYLFGLVTAGLVCLVVVLVTAAVWLSAMFVTPELWNQFVAGLSHQTIGLWDLGYSVFGVVAIYVGKLPALIIHVAVIVSGTVCGAFLLRYKGYHLLDVRLVPFWSIAAIFINPRMKAYDFCVAMILFFAFIYVHSTARTCQAIIIGLAAAAVPVINLQAAKLGFPVSVVLMPSQQFFQLVAFVLMLPVAILSLNHRKQN